MNGHVYIFREGIWLAEGRYWDEYGRSVLLEGQTRVSHDPDAWWIESFLNLMTRPPSRVENTYRVTPFAPDSPVSSWAARNPSLGRLNGMLSVVEEGILSSFTSSDGRFSGCEAYMRLDSKSYRNEGSLFEEGRRLSSWAVVLELGIG